MIPKVCTIIIIPLISIILLIASFIESINACATWYPYCLKYEKAYGTILNTSITTSSPYIEFTYDNNKKCKETTNSMGYINQYNIGERYLIYIYKNDYTKCITNDTDIEKSAYLSVIFVGVGLLPIIAIIGKYVYILLYIWFKKIAKNPNQVNIDNTINNSIDEDPCNPDIINDKNYV